MLKKLPDSLTQMDILFLRFLVGRSKIYQDKDYNDGLTRQNDNEQKEKEKEKEEEKETGWNQRILLGVEKERKIQALEEQQQQKQHDARLTSYFQKMLLATINKKLKNTEAIVNENVQITPQNVELLISLIAKEPRYSVLAEEIKLDSYIRNQLMSLVADQAFMASLGSEKRIVNDLQIAIGMIGTNALRYLVPALMFKQRTNRIRLHYPEHQLFAQKLWRYQLTLGQACTALMLKEGYRRPYEGHLLAAMLNLAYTASFNQYVSSFESVRVHCLAEAREKNIDSSYQFFQYFKPDLASFQSLFISKSDLKMSITLATTIFPQHFQHLLLALTEEVEGVDFELRSVLGKIIFQAVHFAKYEQLRVARIFKKEWLNDYLETAHMDVGTFNSLYRQDLSLFKSNWPQ